MADSIILATGHLYEATIWTRDSGFKGIPEVQPGEEKIGKQIRIAASPLSFHSWQVSRRVFSPGKQAGPVPSCRIHGT